MLFAILFIAVGIIILLNTFGLINGTFWGLLWSLLFIAIGLKMILKKGDCPMCSLGCHQKMHAGCDCECDEDECECSEDGCECECEEKK